MPRPNITNVEAHEANGPILFLYRGILADSAGAGRQRGGSTVGLALTLHDTDSLTAMMVGHGSEVPNSAGIFGGYEGSCNRNRLMRGVDGVQPVGRVFSAADHESWPGDLVELGAKPGFVPLVAGDVLSYSFQGGGGYGDPTERAVESVVDDVDQGYVSVEEAARIYGVVVDGDGYADRAATERRRREIRAERVGGEGPTRPPGGGGSRVEGRTLTPQLTVTGDGTIVCGCGHPFGAGPDWKRSAVRRVIDPQSHGRYVRTHVDLEIREYCCPSCGSLLESNVDRVDAPDLITSELR